jgi:hypothetical protein
MSTINYTNINTILDYISAFLIQSPQHGTQITVIVPFATQRDELEEAMDMRLPNEHGVKVKTIDSFQGDEDDLIFFCLTMANENDPAFLGFLSNWNRINVAITRSKQCLVLVGNMDLWRTRIERIYKQSPKFAFLIMDLTDRGDIVDLDVIEHRLPKDAAEFQAGADNWSLVCPPSQARKIIGPVAVPKRIPGAPENFTAKEMEILKKLDELRAIAKESVSAAKAQAKAAKEADQTTKLVDKIIEIKSEMTRKALAEFDNDVATEMMEG